MPNPLPDESTRATWRKPFIIGYMGWFVLNSLYFLMYQTIAKEMGLSAIVLGLVCPFVPLPLNIGALLWLSRARRWVALGALAAIGTNVVGWTLIALNGNILGTNSEAFLGVLLQFPFIALPFSQAI